MPESSTSPPSTARTQGALAFLRNKFLAGLFIAFPIVVTVWLLKLVYEIISHISRPVLEPIFGHYLGIDPTKEMTTQISFVSFLLTMVVFLLLGLLTSNVIGRRLVRLVDDFLLKVPVVKTIYNVLKQVVDTLNNSQGGMTFQRVVYVQFVGSGRVLGFVTGEFKDRMTGERLTLVFVPTTPSPATGFVFVVRDSELFESGLSLEEGIKMVVSAGLVTPKAGCGTNELLSPAGSESPVGK